MVAEADRLESIDRFTRCVHWLNVMFVSSRRDVRATEPAIAVYRDQVWIGANLRLNVRIYLADIAAVAHVLGTDADSNHVVGRAHATTGPSAQGSVEGSTGVGRECQDADCRIVVAASIGKKRPVTIRCIFFAVDIITERFQASCCVNIPDRVARERQYTDGRVTETTSVATERLLAVRGVVKSVGVTRKRFSSGGRVVVTGDVATERELTIGGVSDASRVVTEGRRPVGGVEAAGDVVRKRGRSGGRVLTTSGVAKECVKTIRRVEVAGGISSERTITGGRIGFAGTVELKCKRTEDAVVMASGIVSERKRSECTVVGSFPKRRVSIVAKEGMISHSGVANAGDVGKECATTDGRVSHAFGVVEKCSRSSGRIEAAGRVVQKRRRANGGVLGSLTRTLISDVEKERSRTHSGVVAPVSVAPERKPAYCSVPHAGGEVEQGVLSFRCVEPRIAAVWRRDNRSSQRCNRKPDQHKHD